MPCCMQTSMGFATVAAFGSQTNDLCEAPAVVPFILAALVKETLGDGIGRFARV